MPIFQYNVSLISLSFSEPELFKTFMGLFGANEQEAKKNLPELSIDAIIERLMTDTSPNIIDIWRAFLKPEYQASTCPANDFLVYPASRQRFISYGENGRNYLRTLLLNSGNLIGLNVADAQARRLYAKHSEVMQQLYNDRTMIDYAIEEYYRWSASLPPHIKGILNDSRYEEGIDRCLSSGVLSWSALALINLSDLQRLLADFSTLDPVFLDRRDKGAVVQISAAALGDLDVDSRVRVLQGGAVTRLLQKGTLVISDLVALEVHLRRALFIQNSLIVSWLDTKKLAMADVLALDPQWRTLLFNDPNQLSTGFDFIQAVSLDALNDFFKSYCVGLLPTLESQPFKQAMPMYMAMLRHSQVKDLPIERRVVGALENGLKTHSLSDAERISIRCVLWQWYAAQCVSQDQVATATQYDFKDAFDHVTVVIEQSLKQGSWQAAESYCEQLALLCARMKSPVHAAYYWCQAANLADKQGGEREAAQRRYYRGYVRGLQLFDLSAEDHLCVLALAASLRREFLDLDDDLHLLEQLNACETPWLPQIHKIEQRLVDSLEQLYTDVQTWLTCVILAPSRVDVAMSRYGADVHDSFKDYLYGALMSLPSTELKWQGIWQALLSGYVLHQLFLPEVPGAKMNQAFFMAELQKCVMDDAFSLETCGSTYIIAGLKALPNLAWKIQQEYPFLHNALLKANVALGVTIDVPVMVRGSSSKLLAMDSPPNLERRHSISSMATPIQAYRYSGLSSSVWLIPIPVTPSIDDC